MLPSANRSKLVVNRMLPLGPRAPTLSPACESPLHKLKLVRIGLPHSFKGGRVLSGESFRAPSTVQVCSPTRQQVAPSWENSTEKIFVGHRLICSHKTDYRIN